MSMFTQFNGPQSNMGPSTKSVLQLVDAYENTLRKIDDHISESAGDTDVHNVHNVISGIKETINSLSLAVNGNPNGTDGLERAVESIKSEIDKINGAIKDLASGADMDELEKVVGGEDKPGTLVYELNALADSFRKANVTLSGISKDLATGKYAESADLKKLTDGITYDKESKTLSVKGDVSAEEYLTGHARIKEYIDFTDWTFVAARFAGATVKLGSQVNGMFVIAEVSNDWTGAKRHPNGNYAMKSGRMYVKYVNSNPFDSIVDFTVTYNGKKFVGSVTQQTSPRVEGSFVNLSYHLVSSTDGEKGDPKVYLAISANDMHVHMLETVQGDDPKIESVALSFYVCGTNIVPIGAKGSSNSVQGLASHIIATDNLDSAEAAGVQVHKTLNFIDWVNVSTVLTSTDRSVLTGLPVPKNPSKLFELSKGETGVKGDSTFKPSLLDENEHYVIGKLTQETYSGGVFSKQCLVYLKHVKDSTYAEPFEATVQCTVDMVTDKESNVKWKGTVHPVVTRGDGKWRDLAFHLDLAGPNDVYLSVSARELGAPSTNRETLKLLVCGINFLPVGMAGDFTENDVASSVDTICTTNCDRIVYGTGEEDGIYFTSRPIAPVEDENNPGLGNSPLATLYDLYLAAVPVGGIVSWPYAVEKTKQQVIDEGLEDEYRKHYDELWDGILDMSTVVSSFANKVPRGYLACDGRSFTSTEYPELAEALPELVLPVKDYAIIRVRLWDDGDAHNPAVAEVLTSERLNQKIDAETAARREADDKLQVNIDTEKSERVQADDKLQVNIDTEKSERVQADDKLQANIDTEKSERVQADDKLQGNIDAEKSARELVDETLQGNIDAEKSARVQEDGNLQANIDAEKARIDAEVKARETADTALQGGIDDLGGRMDREVSDLGKRIGDEKARIDTLVDETVPALKEADATLQVNIDAEENARREADETLQVNVDAEEKARVQADMTLQNNIDTEKARIDTLVGETVPALEKADTTLQDNIDAEAATRGQDDEALSTLIDTERNRTDDIVNIELPGLKTEDGMLHTRIDEEASARRDADDAANSRIDDETAARRTADDALGTRIDSEAQARQKALADEASARANADNAEADVRSEQYSKAIRTAEQAATDVVNVDRRVDDLDRRVETLELDK